MPNPRPAAAPFSRQPLTREHIRDLVQRTLEPLPFVHALWEGGSACFDRTDAWSDVDLQACVDDERVSDAFAAVEAACEKACGIDAVFAVPEPAWHGHAQRFYRFRGQPPWLLLDLCMQKRGGGHRFLETEIHGKRIFLFDRMGLEAAQLPPDRDAREKKLRARLTYLQSRAGMFAHLVEKEMRRRRAIDALVFYQSMILQPLVELLRIRHDPWRHDFGMRYLHEALPPIAARRVQELSYVRNPDDLRSKSRVALRWFDELATDLGRRPRLVPDQTRA